MRHAETRAPAACFDAAANGAHHNDGIRAPCRCSEVTDRAMHAILKIVPRSLDTLLSTPRHGLINSYEVKVPAFVFKHMPRGSCRHATDDLRLRTFLAFDGREVLTMRE